MSGWGGKALRWASGGQEHEDHCGDHGVDGFVGRVEPNESPLAQLKSISKYWIVLAFYGWKPCRS